MASTLAAPAAGPHTAAPKTAKTITVSLQCSEGRFVLPVDPAHTVQEVKREFKQHFEALFTVNMNAFIISHKGSFVMDDASTLESVGVQDQGVLFLIRKRTLPAFQVQEQEE